MMPTTPYYTKLVVRLNKVKHRMNDWERRFITDMVLFVAQNHESGLSAKQRNRITDLYERYH